MSNFILSCESTVDMPYSYISGRNIPILFYTYTVDDKEYVDDMGKDPDSIPNFYKMLSDGKMPKTSQINVGQYLAFFEEQLQKGDLLHIAFGSGMTMSVENAKAAAQMAKEKYPDRKIVVIDSLCSSSGYGMLVDYAADMRDAGDSMDDIIEWVNAHRKKIHHQFYSTEMDFYKRSGRVSGPMATIATILDICPIMRLDDKGKIIAYSKIRTVRKAIKKTVDTMAEHAEGGENYSGKCFICNSDCYGQAEALRDAIKKRFKKIPEIKIFDIGTIIAAHCGPGTVAVFFVGDERAPE